MSREFERVHIVGIGGAGMSAIARVLQGQGKTVTGSDRRASPLVAALQAEGIAVTVGQAPEAAAAADLVLPSSAVPDADADVQAALAAGVPVMRRPEFLRELTAGYDVIAVAGAHGKTTVTGMIVTVMREAGLDPTFIIGGVAQNLGTNGYAGQGPHFVIEADEYQHTFLSLEPWIAVVTNIEYDHPDCFPSPRFLRLAFGDFVDRIRPDGVLVACNDDRVGHAVAASFHANGGKLVLYGLDEGIGVAWQAEDVRPNAAGGSDFVPLRACQALPPATLQLAGRHNVLNALAVCAVAEQLAIPWPVVARGLAAFSGTARRFEVLGEAGGVVVMDDYAHHPTQIRAVLEAARQCYRGQRLVAVWQPHTFSRIRALRDEFTTAFDGADAVLVLPIYAAREQDDGTISHRDIAADIAHPAVEAVDSRAEAVARLLETVGPGNVVLLMGAGDEYEVGQALLAQLVE